MLKFIAAALWLCSITLGAVFWSAQAPTGASAGKEKGAAPLLGGLDYIKTEVVSVPVLRDSEIAGYFLARLVYTAEPEKLQRLSVPADTLLIDQMYSYLYGNPQIDFADKGRIDIDAFRNGLRDSVNKRVGDSVIQDVMVEQMDFLSKSEIRDNVIRRRTGEGKDGRKVASPSSHF